MVPGADGGGVAAVVVVGVASPPDKHLKTSSGPGSTPNLCKHLNNPTVSGGGGVLSPHHPPLTELILTGPPL